MLEALSQPKELSALTVPRIGMLAACILVAMGSGTNYAFSAYAPQLGERLKLTHTQLNIVGIAGNIGVFSSAPVWGRCVDRYGPKPLFATAFVLLLTGYSGIRYSYHAGAIPSDFPSSGLRFASLALCNFMTGVAGTAGIMGSVNTTARTFPDHARASTTGIVLSGFGLSAFFFSTIAGLFSPGDTSSLLLLLTVGTAFPMILGFFFVHPIPWKPNNRGTPANRNREPENFASTSNTIYHRCAEYDSCTPLLGGQDGALVCNCYQGTAAGASSHPESTPEAFLTPQTVRSEDPFSNLSADVRRMLDRRRAAEGDVGSELASQPSQSSGEANIHGWALWKTCDFWLCFSIFGLLTGTGLMYINNVGTISQALIAQANPDYDIAYAARVQAKQVTIVSLMNCLGRICFGSLSDFTKHRLHRPRSYCFVAASTAFLLVQVVLQQSITDVASLSWGSAMLGFVYGGSFSLLPTLCIGYFGLAHFSENFGFATLSPIFTGYLFSIAFGKTLDLHELPPELGQDGGVGNSSSSHPSILHPPAERHRCLEGSACYAEAFTVTILACLVALALSVWMSWRDFRRMDSEEVEYGVDGGYGASSKPGSCRRTVESG
ncbi:MFS general substrate transporter [Pleurotus eryngii]|uniref:MFS general substrate transporter n=1 Tax=Pleurotus eryngii TaxID=5323 RepID=A0A9P5ZT12_PLEER|nr:MFS general substrate transporter [Pleurotus eryngii]